ncbi:uncharacterized protein LOC131929307 [Physella acuta]|uniref:uncharacterized protein LOC131929307 n=1 Tax=Physella acuta TaxID=109671 RepID=UPI0027DDC6BE|nr:uncharacterized protein LOC131929307 [Physella acuta]XP_059141404.1 uncharacterized protein LOC131929307 [Physella acuta]XP_059141413.1 uncharacterized protein LOC131929307 [Physella acuta]
MAEIRIPTELIPQDIMFRLQECIQHPFQAFSNSPDWSQSSSSHMSVPQQSKTSPQFNQQSKTSPQFNQQSKTSPQFNQQSKNSPQFSQQSKTLHCNTFGSSRQTFTHQNLDEVDGSDSVVHILPTTQPTRKVEDAMDDSDIVRIFPDNPLDVQKNCKQDSEIVRIFTNENSNEKKLKKHPDVVSVFSNEDRDRTEPNVVRVITPVKMCQGEPSGSSEGHYFDKTHRSFQPHSSNTTGSKQHTDKTLPDWRVNNNRTPTQSTWATSYNKDSTHRSSRTIQAQPQNREGVMTTPQQQGREGVIATPQTNSVYNKNRQSLSQRFPELPTPPQTPDEEDIGDDEVFSYDFNRRDTPDCTFRRDYLPMRDNSDRSVDTKGLSPFSPSQKMAEITFGEKKQTRKRLSFEEEEEEVNRPHSFDLPKISSAPTRSLPFVSYACKQQTASTSGRARTSSPAFLQEKPTCISPTTTQGFKPYTQSTSSSKSDSPVAEVLNTLEKTSDKYSPKLRIHRRSDGDNATDSGFVWPDDATRPPELQQRRQTLPCIKRRRLDFSYPETEDEKKSLELSHDNAEGDCKCQQIGKDVLHIFSNAYKKMRQDTSNADLNSLKNSMTETNAIFQLALQNYHSIKRICPHRRSSSSSSINMLYNHVI